jgi:hypothetical protein
LISIGCVVEPVVYAKGNDFFDVVLMLGFVDAIMVNGVVVASANDFSKC